MRRFLVTALAVCLTAAACGDDSPFGESTAGTDGTEATTTTGVTTTAPPDTTAGSTTTSEAATTTTAATTTSGATTTTTAVPTTLPVTEHPGLPDAASRSLIDATEVGPGWVVAVVSADTAPGFADGPDVLLLVDPAGARYELAAWPAGGPQPVRVWGLANDGGHALVSVFDPASFETGLVSISIPDGTRQVVETRSDGVYGTAGLTLPTGRDVVSFTSDAATGTDRLRVLRTDGSLWADIASKPADPVGYSWLYGPDGMFLVVGDRTLSVYGNDGTFVRTLDTPPNSICEPARWWDTPDQVLARCVPEAVHTAGGYYHELWVVPLDGSAPSRLTAPVPATWDVVEFGHHTAWRAGGEILLQWWGDCAARGVQRMRPDGTGDWVAVDSDGSPWIVTRAGDLLVVHSIMGCGDFYGPLDLVRADGSLVRHLVPVVPGHVGVIDAAGVIPVP